MYVVGKVRDRGLAEVIQNKLREDSIELIIHFSDQEEMFLLVVKDQKDVEVAHKTFLRAIGQAPPIEVPPEIQKMWQTPQGPLTKSFIYISVVVFIGLFLAQTGVTDIALPFLELLLMSERDNALFGEISQGQFWRLITPAFLHFSLLHILFNMMWLKDLGKIYEYQRGSASFALFFLFCALSSNVAQHLVQGPMFGGMSGVVYGLLGHLWMYKRFHPESDFALPKFDIYLMIGWFFLCMTGLVGNIANTAHGVGLCLGMIVGIWQSPVEQDTTQPTKHLDPFEGLSSEKVVFSFISIAIFIFTIMVEYWTLDFEFFYSRFV